MGDGPGIESAARALGVGDYYPLFSAILTQRPWDDIIAADIDSLRSNRGATDEAVIQAHTQKYLLEITEVLDRCPRDLLLLLKMSDCLRNLDRSLGATHNQHVATADACCGALLLAADRPSPSAEGALEVGRQQNAAACVRAAEVIRGSGSGRARV